MQTEDQAIEEKQIEEPTETALTEEQIAALIADAPSETPSAFVPTDAAGADWVLKHMAAHRAEAALIRENMELMARACDRKAEALLWKFGGALQTYLRGELEGGKGKSKRLPHGVLGLARSPLECNSPTPPPC